MTQSKNCAQIALSSSFKVCVSPFGKVYASARNSDALMIRGEVMPDARKSLSPVNKTSAPALIAALRTGRSLLPGKRAMLNAFDVILFGHIAEEMRIFVSINILIVNLCASP